MFQSTVEPRSPSPADLSGLLRLGKVRLDSHLLERESMALGLSCLRMSSIAFVAGPSLHSVDELGFHYTASMRTSRVAREITGHAQYRRALLQDAQLPVPAGRMFSPGQDQAVRRYVNKLGSPAVVKPDIGRLGAGVATGLSGPQEVLDAIEALQSGPHAGEKVVVEQHRPGTAYRFVVIGDQVVSVVRRTAAHIVGDGHRTVAELVADANAQRQQNPYLRTRLIELDEEATAWLARHGLAIGAIPRAGVQASIRAEAHASTDGIAADVTAETHPDLMALACAAVAAIPGLGHAGVEMLLTDHTAPADADSVSIIDVDLAPHLAQHEFPTDGPGRRVARALVHWHAARDSALQLSDSTTVQINLHASPSPRFLRRKVTDLAEELGIDAEVTTSTSDRVEVMVSGPIHLVALVPALATGGKSAPEITETIPVPSPGRQEKGA